MTRKLGSQIGEAEDVARRKQLANVAFRKLSTVWFRRSRISLPLRLRLYESFVVPVLIYNMGTRVGSDKGRTRSPGRIPPSPPTPDRRHSLAASKNNIRSWKDEFYLELYDSDQAVTIQTDPEEVPPIMAWREGGR